ncbi:hypothetical protein C8J57DRAFT_1243309 [Mycena rebaudengoi]|nr:hypothetical protein C8J57DRAFT_1243309 [Mycena rebaudengoi]
MSSQEATAWGRLTTLWLLATTGINQYLTEDWLRASARGSLRCSLGVGKITSRADKGRRWRNMEKVADMAMLTSLGILNQSISFEVFGKSKGPDPGSWVGEAWLGEAERSSNIYTFSLAGRGFSHLSSTERGRLSLL